MKRKCNTLSVFATDCNAIESSVTTGRDQTEHGDDSVPNFIFNIILAKACYGFWRLFCCGFIYFFVVNVACSSSATPLRSSTDSKTNSWSVHTALLFRICFLAIRARFIWLSLTSRSPPPAQPPTPPSLSYHTQGNSCVFWHAPVARRAVGGFRVFLLYQGLTFLWVCRHHKQEVERFASRVSSL